MLHVEFIQEKKRKKNDDLVGHTSHLTTWIGNSIWKEETAEGLLSVPYQM